MYAIVQVGIGGAFVCFVAIIIAHIALVMKEKGYNCGNVSRNNENLLPTEEAAAAEMDSLDLPESFSELREPLMEEHHADLS